MRYLPVVMVLLLSSPGATFAQISIQIGLPSVRIGFDQVSYPQLVAVPGYPVYYDPGSTSNYFFYDGLYWVYEGDSWYASSWFNGPWDMVEPQWVPLFVLRVPVRYYRQPPRYFGGWSADEPPRWGERWGGDWSRQRRGWDRWDRAAVPAPAPLPVYQREYAGDRYPRPERQHELRTQHYRHEPRDAAVTRVYQAQVQHAARPPAAQPAQPERPKAPEAQPQGRPERPKAPEAQPQARPGRRPDAPEARPERPKAPEAQPQARPERRPEAPEARPERPKAPEAQPQARPERPKAPEAQPQGRPERAEPRQQQVRPPQARAERPKAPEPQPQAQPERPSSREAQPQGRPERPQAREQGKEKDKDKRDKEGAQQGGRGEGHGRDRGD